MKLYIAVLISIITLVVSSPVKGQHGPYENLKEQAVTFNTHISHALDHVTKAHLPFTDKRKHIQDYRNSLKTATEAFKIIEEHIKGAQYIAQNNHAIFVERARILMAVEHIKKQLETADSLAKNYLDTNNTPDLTVIGKATVNVLAMNSALCYSISYDLLPLYKQNCLVLHAALVQVNDILSTYTDKIVTPRLAIAHEQSLKESDIFSIREAFTRAKQHYDSLVTDLKQDSRITTREIENLLENINNLLSDLQKHVEPSREKTRPRDNRFSRFIGFLTPNNSHLPSKSFLQENVCKALDELNKLCHLLPRTETGRYELFFADNPEFTQLIQSLRTPHRKLLENTDLLIQQTQSPLPPSTVSRMLSIPRRLVNLIDTGLTIAERGIETIEKAPTISVQQFCRQLNKNKPAPSEPTGWQLIDFANKFIDLGKNVQASVTAAAETLQSLSDSVIKQTCAPVKEEDWYKLCQSLNEAQHDFAQSLKGKTNTVAGHMHHVATHELYSDTLRPFDEELIAFCSRHDEERRQQLIQQFNMAKLPDAGQEAQNAYAEYQEKRMELLKNHPRVLEARLGMETYRNYLPIDYRQFLDPIAQEEQQFWSTWLKEYIARTALKAAQEHTLAQKELEKANSSLNKFDQKLFYERQEQKQRALTALKKKHAIYEQTLPKQSPTIWEWLLHPFVCIKQRQYHQELQRLESAIRKREEELSKFKATFVRVLFNAYQARLQEGKTAARETGFKKVNQQLTQ